MMKALKKNLEKFKIKIFKTLDNGLLQMANHYQKLQQFLLFRTMALSKEKMLRIHSSSPKKHKPNSNNRNLSKVKNLKRMLKIRVNHLLLTITSTIKLTIQIIR